LGKIGDLVSGARTVMRALIVCAVAADKYLPMAIVMRVDSRSSMYMKLSGYLSAKVLRCVALLTGYGRPLIRAAGAAGPVTPGLAGRIEGGE
jgi:hypothetical protein